MASHLIPCRAHRFSSLAVPPLLAPRSRTGRIGFRIRASNGGDSYLGMWKKAVDRERKSVEFEKIAEKVVSASGGDERSVVDVESKSQDFQRLLEVPQDERDRIQRMQVIDRAAAAIAAARAVIQEKGSLEGGRDGDDARLSKWDSKDQEEDEKQSAIVFLPASEGDSNGVPGPDFWSWTPPSANDQTSYDSDLQALRKPSSLPTPAKPIIEKERPTGLLSIPFESKLIEGMRNPLLQPLESQTETDQVETSHSVEEDQEISDLFSAHATEAADALGKAQKLPSSGVNPDGSRYWRETGIEKRPDGVICRWTLERGVSADEVTEWQVKFWEASDEVGYKELGSEKNGRDSHGNVWREFWRESMRQDAGLVHLEKTADKWGKNGKGEEWQEKWWEHYDASGQAEKWAHKWCSIDPTTPLDAGHAHVWHERWGETYDGHGGSTKYTDKWAERCEDGGGWWSKWGDKWDENFDPNGHGVKQGEKWWQGGDGSQWNRTWGEHHNGSGWIHKYGKSSCGEHWDTHVPQDTWYERFPHFGFYHCFDNSVQLREVLRPSEISED